MNWEQVESKWEQLMASAKENWAGSVMMTCSKYPANASNSSAKIQETYGITRREAEKQVWDWGKSVERTQKKIA